MTNGEQTTRWTKLAHKRCQELDSIIDRLMDMWAVNFDVWQRGALREMMQASVGAYIEHSNQERTK